MTAEPRPEHPDRLPLGQYLTLGEFCTCTATYHQFAAQIDPYPRQGQASLAALQALATTLLDPIIEHYGRERFQLTYGFCSVDLRRYLNRHDPLTGRKYGRIAPSRDQHMAAERNRTGRLFCERGGAACDFLIAQEPSDRVVDWLLAQGLPFDSLYFYGGDRPLHLSYGPEQKRAIWGFTAQGTPTRAGLETWVRQARAGGPLGRVHRDGLHP